MKIKIVIGICIGLIIFVRQCEQHPQILSFIERQVTQAMSDSLACQVSGRLVSASLSSASLEFADFTVRPRIAPHDRWGWSCARLRLKVSWWKLISQWVLGLSMHMSAMAIESQVNNGKVELEEHIKKMVEEQRLPIPLELTNIQLEPAQVTLYDNEHQHRIKGAFTLHASVTSRCTVLKTDMSDWQIVYNNSTKAKLARGSIELHRVAGETDLQSRIHLDLVDHQGNNISHIISGTYRNNKGEVSIEGTPDACVLNDCSIASTAEGISCSGTVHVPLSLARIVLPDIPLKGVLHCSGAISTSAQGFSAQGVCRIEGASYADRIAIPEATTHVVADDRHIQVDSICCDTGHGILGGSIAYSFTDGNLNAQLNNDTDLVLAGVAIESGSLKASCSCSSTGTLNGSVGCRFRVGTSPEQQVALVCSGTWPQYHLDAQGAGYTLNGTITHEDGVTIDRLICRKGYQTIAQAQAAYNNGVVTMALTSDLDTLLPMISTYTGIKLAGSGVISLDSCYTNGVATTHLSFGQGALRIPHTYNCITSLDTMISYDPQARRLALDRLKINCFKGSLECARGVIYHDQDYALSAYMIPLTCNACQLTVKKDFFVTVSGSVAAQQYPGRSPLLSGSLVIDRAQCKENLFALIGRNDSSAPMPGFSGWLDQLGCSIAVCSKDPIRIKTGLLDADVHVNLMVSNTLAQPKLEGSIKIGSGMVALPYKPLYISKGLIRFPVDKPTEPIFDLVLKNSIKQYAVTMHIAGTPAHPNVTVSSSPTLAQERIISLLLAGSTDSLTGAVPAVLLQNMKQLLFDTEHTPSKLHTALSQLFAPFKYVHLIPSFSDQTSRGGLRGAIAIDIGERWRALIQKNFSLTEDTRFELEYALSDDILVRGVRDERRDIDAELEWKWKF